MEEKKPGDSVVVMRTEKGKLYISDLLLEADKQAAKDEINQWLETAKETVKHPSQMEYLNKQLQSLNPKERRSFFYWSHVEPFGVEEIDRWSWLPSWFFGGIMGIKLALRLFKKAIQTGFEKGILKKAKKEKKDVFVYIRIAENPISPPDKYFMVGLTTELLTEGYEFKGEDETGELRKFKKLRPGRTIEWSFPGSPGFPVESEWTERFKIPEDQKEDFAEKIFPMVKLHYLTNLCREKGISFLVAGMYESSSGRYTKILEPQDLADLEIQSK